MHFNGKRVRTRIVLLLIEKKKTGKTGRIEKKREKRDTKLQRVNSMAKPKREKGENVVDDRLVCEKSQDDSPFPSSNEKRTNVTISDLSFGKR